MTDIVSKGYILLNLSALEKQKMPGTREGKCILLTFIFITSELKQHHWYLDFSLNSKQGNCGAQTFLLANKSWILCGFSSIMS